MSRIWSQMSRGGEARSGRVGGTTPPTAEGAPPFAAGVQGQEVDPVLQRHNPTVEQITRPDLLAAEVVDQEDAPIGLDLEGCLVELVDIIEDQVQSIHGQLAPDHNEGAADLPPTRTRLYPHLQTA